VCACLAYVVLILGQVKPGWPLLEVRGAQRPFAGHLLGRSTIAREGGYV